VGTGWNSFTKVISGGDGILYGLKADGTLNWYRHVDYATGGKTWEGPKVVGTGWGGMRHIFSMGHGIIYGVQQDGTLLWYNHTGYATGQRTWTGPQKVGSEWTIFSRIIPAGGGVILGIKPDGALHWYRHENYAVGVSRIGGGTIPGSNFKATTLQPIWTYGGKVGDGWSGFQQVLALLPSTPDVVR
jgi:hypothetical protein